MKKELNITKKKQNHKIVKVEEKVSKEILQKFHYTENTIMKLHR